MKKTSKITLMIVALASTIVLFSRFSNDKADKNTNLHKAEIMAKVKQHIVAPNKAHAMIESYQNEIAPLLQQHFAKENPSYVSNGGVTHEIEPLVEYLNSLKEKGYSNVTLKFAATNDIPGSNSSSDEVHLTVVFTGNNSSSSLNDLDITKPDSEFYDLGEYWYQVLVEPTLAPPPCCKLSTCTSCCPSSCSNKQPHHVHSTMRKCK